MLSKQAEVAEKGSPLSLFWFSEPGIQLSNDLSDRCYSRRLSVDVFGADWCSSSGGWVLHTIRRATTPSMIK